MLYILLSNDYELIICLNNELHELHELKYYYLA